MSTPKIDGVENKKTACFLENKPQKMKNEAVLELKYGVWLVPEPAGKESGGAKIRKIKKSSPCTRKNDGGGEWALCGMYRSEGAGRLA